MKQARQGNSLLWWCVLGTSVVAHGLWLYVCSDSMLATPLSHAATPSTVPLTLQFAQLAAPASALPEAAPAASPAARAQPARGSREPVPAPVAADVAVPRPSPPRARQATAGVPKAISTETVVSEPAIAVQESSSAAIAVPHESIPELVNTSPVVTSAPDYVAPPAPPQYPDMARKRGWEGKVWLEIPVSAQGRSGEPVVLRSSGFELLDRAAVAAAVQWRFRPEQRSGRPVDTRVQVPVAFALR